MVAGNAGFIGCQVARALLAHSARVAGLDNYNDYYSPALERDRDQELRRLPIQPGNVPATFADIRRAQAESGFTPTATLEEGIPGFIRWFKEYLK